MPQSRSSRRGPILVRRHVRVNAAETSGFLTRHARIARRGRGEPPVPGARRPAVLRRRRPAGLRGDREPAGDADPRRRGHSTPFAVGIQGSWGCGKSTLMERLRASSRKAPTGVEVRTVSYNAWTAEGEDVLAGARQVGAARARPEHPAAGAPQQEADELGPARESAFVAGFFRLGGVVDEAWKRLSVDASTRNQLNDLVREAMERLDRQDDRELGAEPADRRLHRRPRPLLVGERPARFRGAQALPRRARLRVRDRLRRER